MAHKRRAVSEVVGALLLIVVVVSAVASLAYFVSAAQKQAEQRNSYLTNTQNDNLQVTYALFSPNDPTIQWELDGCSPNVPSTYAGNWDVQQVVSNPAVVNLIPKTTGATPLMGVPLASGSYNAISKGKAATLSTVSPYTVTLGSGTCTFEPSTWDSIILTVRNTNTQASSLQGVQLNGIWRSAWDQVDDSGNILLTLGVTQPPLPIAARGSVNILLNPGALSLPAKNGSLTVVVFSGAGNYFTTTVNQPSAVPRSTSATQISQVVSRDVLTLDGSQSYATGSSIQSFEWRLDIPTAGAGCTATAFANPANYDTAYVMGETVQYAPETIFSAHMTDCIAGPVRATLVVTDTDGFIATSVPIVIAADPNLDPVGSVSAVKGGSCVPASCPVTVTVRDIFGNLVNGAVVNAVKTFGDVAIAPPSATTSSGTASFTVTWTSGGSADFETGTLLPQQLSFP